MTIDIEQLREALDTARDHIISVRDWMQSNQYDWSEDHKMVEQIGAALAEGSARND